LKGPPALFLIGLLALVTPRGATAAELGSPDAPLSVETHGFVSQGLIKTTANNYLAQSASDHGSLEFTQVGINFTSQLTDKLRVGVQLFAEKLGPVGTYSAKMDWFYLDYLWRDWLGMRAGRVKLPFGLYNDTSDIDSARVPVLLPPSVYPATKPNFFLAQTGVELYGFINLRKAGALDYLLYTGSIYIDLSSEPGAAAENAQFSNPYLVGGRLLWETPLDGLRVGGSIQKLRLYLSATIPATAATPAIPLTDSVPALLWIASLEYAAHDLLVAAEYGRTRSRVDSNIPAFSVPTTVGESSYVMTAYRVRPWLQPGVYYSLAFPNVDFRTRSRADMQHDVAATLRFDINAHWIVKLEGHYMHGTAGLDPTLNGGASLDTLAKDWGLFLAKTTAYF
jgi:hypothetical protein